MVGKSKLPMTNRLECGGRSSSSCFRDFRMFMPVEMRACLQKSNAKSRCERTYRLEFREQKQQKLETLGCIRLRLGNTVVRLPLSEGLFPPGALAGAEPHLSTLILLTPLAQYRTPFL